MNDFTLLLPEFMLAALALLVLGAGLLLSGRRQHLLSYVSAFGLAGLAGLAGFSLVLIWGESVSLYGGQLWIDSYALFFKGFFLVLGVLVVLSGVEYVRKHVEHQGEYYGILLFTLLAMMLMAASGELLTAYIALELLSVGFYVLVASGRYNPRSGEAGVKFVIMGAFSSALFLYGISHVYGLLGTTRFGGISEVLAASPDLGPGVLIGLVLIIAGLGFKIAAVPFHTWAPDIYEGAPAPVAACLAVGFKVATFALILRLFTEALLPAVGDWQLVVAVIAALTMTLGNLVALVQHNIKRLLAYSSIAHSGYLLLGVAALASVDDGAAISVELSHLAVNGVMLHLAAYGVSNMAAFVCVISFYNATGKEEIADFAGLARRSPALAMVFAASLLSLAGVPVFAGFTGKLYLFKAAAAQGLLWLSVLAVLTSVISLYYYLMVVRWMYLKPVVDHAPVRVPKLNMGMLGVLLTGIVLLGVYPAPLLDAIQNAGDALLSSEGVIRLVQNLD
jgi:NADH-quinone oxidoreductase subunit N